MQKERLGDAVKRIREENNWSLEDVRNQSEKQLAVSYINRIENNQVDADNLSIAKVRALAKGLKKSEDYIFALARGLDLNKLPENQELISIINELPKNRQQDVLEIARLFFAQTTVSHSELNEEKDSPSLSIENNELIPELSDMITVTSSEEFDPDIHVPKNQRMSAAELLKQIEKEKKKARKSEPS